MHAQNPDLAVPARRAALAVIPLVALSVLFGAGCSKKLTSQLIPNELPEVRLTGAPTARDPARPDFYAYTMQWVGHDRDGRVDHFILAVDPIRADTILESDTTWHVTARNESTFFFPAGGDYGDPTDPNVRRDPKSQAPHVISVFAVDNQGMRSRQPATRAFYSFTQCPTVSIDQPTPIPGYTALVTPTVTFRWSGDDPDGQFTVKPVRWVFKLFGQKNPDFPHINDYVSYAEGFPDSVRRQYQPDFPGWNSTGADTATFQYRNLNPNSTYIFVVTGFDEAGAYDPVFQPGRNMLKFVVTFAGSSGPLIRMFSQFFDYTYPFGGYDSGESRWFKFEVPADQPITFSWVAAPPEGANIRRYRWVMDLADLTNQTPRTDEARDLNHWSAWSVNTTSATLPPFTVNGEEHLFYIEAEDSNGLVCLGILFFTVVRSTFERSLLFVDDTRLTPDRRTAAGVYQPPGGPWPTAAELDSFLFAKGDFPWKGYPVDPLTGSQYRSTPGIFNGYAYDTIGTRGISADGTVPLSLLGLYKHVVWYTDEQGAGYSGQTFSLSNPITALRLTNSPSKPAILSTYMIQGYRTDGGHVWLCGGGAAYATLVAWNKASTAPNEYNNIEPNPELRPGRMMYDFTHWREGISMNPAQFARRFGSTGFGNGLGVPDGTPGGNRPGRHWPPNPLPPTPPSAPNYALLPDNLEPKAAPDDLPPAQRRANADWYRNEYRAEYISAVTFVREDYDDDPDAVKEYSVLDTLYLTEGHTAPVNSPVMTYYHGRENQPLIFSGFNFWFWKRAQCIQLVDWVLHEVWGLQRSPAPRLAPAPLAARQRSR
jgi:hypothetical protein